MLDKARFEFSPLGKTFSTGLDKTAQGYQEGVIKLLKDIRDGLNRRPSDNRPNDEFDNKPDDGFDYRYDYRSDDKFDNRSDDSSFNDVSFDDGSDLNKKYNSLLLKYFQLKKYKRRIR